MEQRPIAFAGFPNADAPTQELISRCVHCGLCLATGPPPAAPGAGSGAPRGSNESTDCGEGEVE